MQRGEVLLFPPFHLLARVRRVSPGPPSQASRQRRESRADDVPRGQAKRGQRLTLSRRTGPVYSLLHTHESAEPAGHRHRREPDGQSEDDGDDGSRPRRARVSGGGVPGFARAERGLLELGVRQVLGPALLHGLDPPFPVRHGLGGGRRQGSREVSRGHDGQKAQIELEESRGERSHHRRDDGGHERALREPPERLQRRRVERRAQVSKVERGEVEEHDVLDAGPHRPHDSHDGDERPERARDPRDGAVPEAGRPSKPLGARSFAVQGIAVRGRLVHLVVVVVGDVGALLPFPDGTNALVLVYPDVVQLVAPGVSDRLIDTKRRILGDGPVVGVDPRVVPLRRRAHTNRAPRVPHTTSAQCWDEPARRFRLGTPARCRARRAHPGAQPIPSDRSDRCDYRSGRGRVPHRRDKTPHGRARACNAPTIRALDTDLLR